VSWAAAAIAALLLQAQAPPAVQPGSPAEPLPPPPPSAEGAPAPPPYDPAPWWSTPLVKPLVQQDPLWGRRPRRGENPPRIDVGVEPSLYRLWGLQPLQSRILRRNEMILEIWRRPAKDLRQVVIRVTVRGDGRAFVNARAGLLCCEPPISRRVDIDAELPDPAASMLLQLRTAPLWDAPSAVEVDYGGGAVSALCIDGVSWDVILVTPDRARRLRRACHDPEVGQIADAVAPALAAALGRDPRFDMIFPKGSDLSAERAAYAALLAGGGRLKPPAGSPQPQDAPPPPAVEQGDDAPEEAPAEAAPTRPPV
jgi:hypothetical protein